MLRGVKTGMHIWLRSVTLSGKAVVIRSFLKASLSFSFLPLLSFPYYNLLTDLFLVNPLAFWYHFPLIHYCFLSRLVPLSFCLSCYLPFRVVIFPWWVFIISNFLRLYYGPKTLLVMYYVTKIVNLKFCVYLFKLRRKTDVK